jgi:hypothetical protein
VLKRAVPDRKLAVLFASCVALVLSTSVSAMAPAAFSLNSERSASLKRVDGGPNYYARSSHALPTRASYFPIGGWLNSVLSQSDITKDKAVGLNLYIGVADPEGSDLGLLQTKGMRAFVQADERTRFPAIGTETAGWLLADEIDMLEGPAACNGSLQAIKNGLPVDGRARYNNYGKGVLLWETNAEAACFVEAQHLVSSDLYWFTDPNQRDMIGEPWLPEHGRQMALAEVRRAANYGYQIDRMRALDGRDGRRKPIWAFVEVGWPFTETAAQGGRAILPKEIRAAVWHSLIAGARGILYFDYQFGGPCTDSVLRRPCYPENRAMVKSVNRQIKKLARVLNAPTVTSRWKANPPVRAMVKWHHGNFYVFAGSRENRSSTGRFSIPCVGRARATVVGERRHIPVRRGSFRDSFASGNAIHIYRIGDGSGCRLRSAKGTSTSGPRGRTRSSSGSGCGA